MQTPAAANPELLWLNGRVMPLSQGTIGIEDRGFQFADGVYETLRVYNCQPFALRDHMRRLERSCAGIELKLPMSVDKLAGEIRSLVRQSGLTDASLYLQVTRGCSPRNHLLPADLPPTVLFNTRALSPVVPIGSAPPAALHPVEDIRWRRCWIKSIALLPNVLARNQAARAGADEAAFIENGHVNECSSSNIFAMIRGMLVTPPVGDHVLPGITRAQLLDIARAEHIPAAEHPLTVDEALTADELFIASTIREIVPVARWDGRTLKTSGTQITYRLHAALRKQIQRDTGLAESGNREQ